MPRHPDNVLQVSLRIRKELHRKLKSEAAKHRVSLNNEIALRLHDSFEDRDSHRSLATITMHMGLVWQQIEGSIAASQYERAVARAVLEEKDPKVIIDLLKDWLWQREMARNYAEATKAAKRIGLLS